MENPQPDFEHDLIIERLIAQHQLPLSAFLRAILPGVRDVSDIRQEVNIVIWRKRGDFRPDTNFKAWMFAIARLTAMDAQRRYKRDQWLVFDESLLDPVVEEFTAAEDSMDTRQVALSQCLATLRQEDLNLLRHRYMSKVKLDGYARRVNRSVTALKVRLHKLRNKLRHCIEERLRNLPPE